MTDTLPELSRHLSSLVERLSSPVVAVLSGSGAASGFVWRDGHVVTAEEALAADDGIVVALGDGRRLPAVLVGRDASTDVALLRVEEPLPPAVPLDAAAPRRVGELALAIGRGRDGTTSALGMVGTVGPAWRSLRGGRIDARLGLDLRLPRHAQGGLAVDAEGRAFGMTVLGPRRSTLAIPAATIDRVAAQLLAHGRVPRGYLGLSLQPLRVDGSGERGALVLGVEAAGPGQNAGLRQGDIIVRFAGEPLGGPRPITDRLGPETVGQTVELGILRGGEHQTIALVIGERPAA